MILIIGFIAVASLVVGVSFVLRCFVETPDVDKIVTPEEHDKVQKDFTAAKEETEILRTQLDLLAVDLEDSKSGMQKLQAAGAELEALRNKESASQSKISQLQHDLDFLYTRADTQASEATQVIEALDTENKVLKNEMSALASKLGDGSVDELKSEKEKLRTQLNETSVKLKSLENNFTSSRDQSRTQLAKAETTVSQLNQENQKLKAGIHTILAKIEQVETAFECIKQQKEEHLHHAHDTIRELNQKMDQLTRDRSQNSDTISMLENELRMARAMPVADLYPGHVSPQMETSTSVSPSGSASIKELQKEVERLKAMNDILGEQEKLLQAELVKHRARAFGLESICAELRKQINQKT